LSHFGDLVRAVRKERGFTMDVVAKRIGTGKGYISGIENDTVNPPSIRLIKRYATVLGLDARHLARLAWVDKAPDFIREDAEAFLGWCEAGKPQPR